VTNSGFGDSFGTTITQEAGSRLSDKCKLNIPDVNEIVLPVISLRKSEVIAGETVTDPNNKRRVCALEALWACCVQRKITPWSSFTCSGCSSGTGHLS